MRTISRTLALLISSTAIFCTTCWTNTAMAAEASQASIKNLPVDIMNFFAGEWQGEGEFASGKKIAADVSFTPDLDKQWLQYRHTDRAPNQYQSLALWGVDRAVNKIVMVGGNNFGSARVFYSEGWQDNALVFSKADISLVKPDSNDKAASSMAERFHFIRLNENSFKMIYENQRDGSQWRMVDYLIFTRKPSAK